jgi:hypothetical protein
MPGKWELRLKRLGLQQKKNSIPPVRTYGTYQVFIDDAPVALLAGHICERTGPGDNSQHGDDADLRIREGRYALSTQFGKKYRSVGYTDDTEHPMPGFALLGTEPRTAILVHPGHPPRLYVSSVGCLNPTRSLAESDDINFTDSRGRVIALIDSLKNHDPDAFAKNKIGTNTRIENAWIVIDGEPMGPIPAGANV